jgi:hypothetical protein
MTGTKKSGAIDMDQALLDPGSVFSSPEVLLEHDGLSGAEKIEILRRWEYDASEICVAVEEGMPGDESNLLRRVLLALEQLSGDVHTEQIGPTKQHGISRSAIKRT